ncbi:MAG: radical SAM protein [Paludibacter sp.]|nr:radical SAM protein [Bacteroidales bacterium]MCM1069137.1 radical SAM protein [Prevotella sp.]MCM1353576.1 radical SAM protein [Bacteroides sp.]MCM1442737.1 radical SAM protein [Muribaculum sp.]MCM1481627.1 radical SAM protein [Paludibacter sp.]
MLKYTDYDIVFQEIPDETTLALNLSLCPNHCEGCHSPQLADDIGTELTTDVIDNLLKRYGNAVTCISLMGGDNDPIAVDKMAIYIRQCGKKAAWYSGKETLPPSFDPYHFDYVKVGPYIACYGGLKARTTNQRMYKIDEGKLIDITHRMQRS